MTSGESASAAARRVRDSAMQMFLNEGVAAVTMDRLAAELAMSKKTIYRWYPSRQALLTDILDGLFADLRQDVDRIRGHAGTDAQEQFVALVTAIAAHMRVLGRPQAELRRREPSVWEHGSRLRRELIIEPLEDTLRQAHAQGRLRKELQPQFITYLVALMVENLAQSTVLAELSMSVGDVLGQLATILQSGMFKQPADIGNAEDFRDRDRE